MQEYRIEFGSLKIGAIARKNLQEVCDSNWASSGPKVKKFEEEWGRLFNYKYNAAMSSGTDAVLNACLALYTNPEVKPGDEIIVPALSFIATSNAVKAAGFKPVWVDVDWDLNINPTKIANAITRKTRAIIAVHTMGKPAKIDRICNLGLPVIEDACEAHGARYKDKYIGNWGDMACFSYYIAHLICCGEGGMVSTNNSLYHDSLISTRTHGRPNGELYFNHVRYGLNSKMNDLEASIGLEGVSEFWNTFYRRKNNLYFLMNKLSFLSNTCYINTESTYETVCPHGFTITVKDSDRQEVQKAKYGFMDFYKYLEDKGIKCKRNFGCIPTQHAAFSDSGHKLGDFPVAEHIGTYGLHFGIHQYLTQEDLEFIVKTVSEGAELFKIA